MVVIREAEIVINPIDNVTPALSRLANMISGRFSGVRMDIELADTIFSDLQRVTDLTAGLGDKINVDVALNDNSANVARNISNSSQQAARGVEKIADASSKVGRELNETERKSSRFFSTLEQSSRSVVASLDGVLTKFAAIAVTGSAGGVSWLGAKSSEKYQQEVIESIATRNGMPEATLAKKFIGEAGEPGGGADAADQQGDHKPENHAKGGTDQGDARGVPFEQHCGVGADGVSERRLARMLSPRQATAGRVLEHFSAEAALDRLRFDHLAAERTHFLGRIHSCLLRLFFS